LFGVGEADWLLPENGWRGGSNGAMETLRGEHKHFPARGHFASSGLAGGLHLVDCAESDDVVALICRHGFDTLGPDFCVEAKGAYGFAEKSGLASLRFGESDVDLRKGKSDRNAGKAATGAKIEERLGRRRDIPGAKETVREVAKNNLLWGADRGEIDTGIPLEQHLKVGGKLIGEVRRYGEAAFGEERCDFLSGETHEPDTVLGMGRQTPAASTRTAKMRCEKALSP